jgi:hypothetical protein
VNKKDVDPENGQIRPMKKEDVNAITVIERKCFGAPRPEYSGKGWFGHYGSGINTFFVVEARTSIGSRLLRSKQDEVRRDRV